MQTIIMDRVHLSSKGNSGAFVLPAAGPRKTTHDPLQMWKGCDYHVLLEYLIPNIRLAHTAVSFRWCAKSRCDHLCRVF